MKMLRHLFERKWDMLLCVLMIFAISTTVFSGFYVPAADVRDYGMTVFFALVLTAALTVIDYDRRSLVIGIAVFAVVCAAAALVAAQLSGVNIFRDREDNPSLRFLLELIVALAVFLLSRRRVLNALLYAGGTLTIALVQFLYTSNHLFCMLLFLVSCGMMQMYRNYVFNILHSRTLKTAQGSAVAVSAAVCLLALLVGYGLFYGIVAPLHPPKQEIKIITKYMSLEVLERIGVATEKTVKDPNLKTSNRDKDTETARKKGKEKDKSEQGSNMQKARQQKKKKDQPTRLGQSNRGGVHTLRDRIPLPLPLLLALLLIAAVAAAILIKLWLRRRWLARVRAQDPRAQIRLFYLFWLRKWRHLQIRKRPEETPAEFAAHAAPLLSSFRVGDNGLPELTAVFTAVVYGGMKPEEAQLQGYLDFHRAFYRHCREYLGKLKYMAKFFIL